MAEEIVTALVKIKPQADVEVIAFYNESLRLREYAEARTIITAEDLKPATNDLSIIAKVKKAMDEKRKDYLKPFQDHIKETNAAFLTLMDPIEIADKITRSKILAFQAEQECIRREQEEINRLRMEAAQKEAALNGGVISESVNLVEVSPEAPKRVSTGMGTVGQRMIRKWEVIDMAQVPEEYKIIDSARVTKVVKAGIPSIPGIRIYDEPILTVSARD
jgi:hypothetical protein